MRQWIYRTLLGTLWVAGMALVMVAMLAPRFHIVAKLMLLAGGFIASVSTVALAEEVAEAFGRRDASPV